MLTLQMCWPATTSSGTEVTARKDILVSRPGESVLFSSGAINGPLVYFSKGGTIVRSVGRPSALLGSAVQTG